VRFSSWWRFTVGCRIIVYVLNGAIPSNVKRMSLIFKISKINLCDVNYRNRVTTAFLGAKQEGLAFVNFLNKLIVSCKEAVRIPIFFGYF
jgi:hypothetical protein